MQPRKLASARIRQMLREDGGLFLFVYLFLCVFFSLVLDAVHVRGPYRLVGGIALAAIAWFLIVWLVSTTSAAPSWELKTPTTARGVIRQNPAGAIFSYGVLVALAVGGFAADNTFHWPVGCAALAGLPLGSLVWWLMLAAYGRGWIQDE
jgi:hypothetical protein